MRRLVLSLFIASLAFVVGVVIERIMVNPKSGSVTMPGSDVNLLTENTLQAEPASVSTEPASVSPYEIKGQIDEYNRGNADKYFELDTLWNQLRIGAGEWDNCLECAQAELFAVELDDKPGKEVLLKLTQGTYGNCRYLIFKPSPTNTRAEKTISWKFIGHIDHDFNRYVMSEHRTFKDGSTRFLVIEGQTASGTGVASYDDSWYQVSESGIRKVLTSISSGHLYMAGDFGRDVTGKVIYTQLVSEPKTIEIEYSVQYTSLDFLPAQKVELFTRKKRVAYVWDSCVKEFVFDEGRSEMSEEEYEIVYNLSAISNEEFLKDNLKDLEKIATGRSAWRKEWLRKLLEKCAVTPERERLNQTLLQ